jgi:hypothetical protein
MLPIATLLVPCIIALGAYGLWRGWQALDVVRQLLARPTSRISDIQEGHTEVAGTVAAEQPAKGAHGADCAIVALEVVHEWTTGSGKNSSTLTHTEVRIDLARSITLDDGTGSCTLRTGEGVTVVARQRRWSMGYDEFCTRYPADVSLLGRASHGKVIRYEQCIEVGQRALISGFATPDPETAPKGYRQGAGASFLVGGDSERKLLVVSSGQPLGALRAGLPAALMFLCGVGLLGYAGWFGYLCALAWK